MRPSAFALRVTPLLTALLMTTTARRALRRRAQGHRVIEGDREMTVVQPAAGNFLVYPVVFIDAIAVKICGYRA